MAPCTLVPVPKQEFGHRSIEGKKSCKFIYVSVRRISLDIHLKVLYENSPQRLCRLARRLISRNNYLPLKIFTKTSDNILLALMLVDIERRKQ